jgi:phosphoacetylglucosamine mutase
MKEELSHILVQTAYCNSKATKFLIENGINTQLVKTGVKFAHKVTAEYDIGANDEPNGHGTVAYKPERVYEILGQINSLESRKLIKILELSNLVVGDSIANLLVIEGILYDLDMNIMQFNDLYSENPSKLYKAVVSDRSKFKVIEDESRLTEPAALQDAID